MEYLSVFSPNAGKCRPEKLRIRTLFTHCRIMTWTFYCAVREMFFQLICGSEMLPEPPQISKMDSIAIILEN